MKIVTRRAGAGAVPLILGASFLAVLGAFLLVRWYAAGLPDAALPRGGDTPPASSSPPAAEAAASSSPSSSIVAAPPPSLPPPESAPQDEPEPTAPLPPPAGEPPPLPPLRDIELSSVVALRCSFTDASGTEAVVRGSGVISNAQEGYILTNRHVVDLKWAHSVAGESDLGYKDSPDQCVGALLGLTRAISPIPQATSPFNPYPYFDVTLNPIYWDVSLDVAFRPAPPGASPTEAENLDFAVLKIKEWNPDRYRGDRRPPVFLAAPFLASALPASGEWTLIPGYAFQAIGQDSFDTYRLHIATHVFSYAAYGDQKYAAIPMTLVATVENPDVAGGRSGSPMYWRGYVIGLRQSTLKDDRRQGIQISARIIAEVLREANLAGVIERLF